MTTPLLCLLGFAGWAVLLVVAVGTARAAQVLTGKATANGFPSGTRHGGDAYWRLNRAHINTLESLPVFASVVLVAAVAQVSDPSIDRAAVVALGARVLQSLVHISGGSNMHVNVRFTFFLVQLGSFVEIGVRTALALG
jgi:uncharacterized MAPEG superfamily protein